MRSLISLVSVVLVVSLVCVSSVEAKGGRGGGGGGNRGGGRSHGGKPGGHKVSAHKQPTRSGGDKQLQSGRPAASEQHAGKPDKKSSEADAGKTTDAAETTSKKQKQLELAQRQRDKRLSQADHLREIAERNGNQNLAANADRMEAHAHELYQQRVDHLSKFGVTDPALDPGTVFDPGSVLDPSSPTVTELLPAAP
jgi:hypothetical protein